MNSCTRRLLIKYLIILPLALIVLIILHLNGYLPKKRYVLPNSTYLTEEGYTDTENLVYSSNVEVFNIVEEMMEGKNYTPTVPFKYQFKCNNCSKICRNPVKLMFLVKTSTNNFEKRDAIRRTWGSSKNFIQIRTIFLVGEKDEDRPKLEKEFEEFKDIIQGNFIDHQFNSTLKTLMGLQWANEFCLKNTEFFMFVDDDYYVSTKNILKFLENPFLYPGTENNENIKEFNPYKFSLYAGNIHMDASPIRDKFEKSFIPFDEYPYDAYPPYAGSTYIFNRNTLERMYYASLFFKTMRFDDAYIGILAYNLKIKPLSNTKNIVLTGENYTFDRYEEILAVSGYSDTNKLLNVWNEHTVAESKISISND